MDSINNFAKENFGVLLNQDQTDAFIIFIMVSFGVWVFLKLLGLLLSHVLTKTSNHFAKIFVKELHSIPVFFHLIIGIYAGLSTFEISSNYKFIAKLIQLILLLLIIYYIGRVLTKTIKRYSHVTSRSIQDRALASAYLYLSVIARFFIWIFGVVLVLSNLGYDVTALVAGLGIGAFAIGLALKGIVQDIISSFLIIFDRPIKYGDYILVDKNYGRVVNIGIKNTRLKSTAGSEIIIPNSNIIDKVLINFDTSEIYPISVDLNIEISDALTGNISKIIKTTLNSFKEIKTDSVKIILKDLKKNNAAFEIFFLYKFTDRSLIDEKIEEIISKIFLELSENYSVTSISLDTEVFKL